MEVLEHVPDPAAVLAEMFRVASRWVLVSVPREPLWRGLNMARGSYLRDFGNTPGHLNHWSKRSFATTARPPRRDRRAALALSVDDGPRPRRGVSAGRSEDAASYGRGAALLSALIGVTGLLTYAFHSLAAHALGRDGYGVIAVLWAAVFLVASVIYRPVEQLLSRTLAERRAQGRPIGSALRVAATIQFGLVLAFLAVALALRGPIEDELFSGSSTLYWCLVVAGAAYAASYFARGFLAGEQRFGLYGGLVLMESASRVVFGVLLVVGVLDGRNAAAIAIAAAPLLSLFVVPWALGRHVRRTAAPPTAR